MKFEAIFILSFTFAVSYCNGATATMWFFDLVLVFYYLYCYHKVFTQSLQ